MKRMVICLLFMIAFSSGTIWADILIIAHKDVPETTLSQKDMQEIFLGKRVKWKDNSKIHPATVKDPELHKAFLKQYVKTSPAKWKAHWKRMVFTGTGRSPKQFDTQEKILEYVANTAGAIGYVDSETSTENVNVIEIK